VTETYECVVFLLSQARCSLPVHLPFLLSIHLKLEMIQ